MGFEQDFWGKVVGIPLACALSPMFEALARRMPRIALLERRYNPAHVVVFTVTMAIGLAGWAKQPAFELNWDGWHHRRNKTPFVVVGANDRVHCVDNPLYCEGFSILREVACWRGDDAGCYEPSDPPPPVLERGSVWTSVIAERPEGFKKLGGLEYQRPPAAPTKVKGPATRKHRADGKPLAGAQPPS